MPEPTKVSSFREIYEKMLEAGTLDKKKVAILDEVGQFYAQSHCGWCNTNGHPDDFCSVYAELKANLNQNGLYNSYLVFRGWLADGNTAYNP